MDAGNPHNHWHIRELERELAATKAELEALKAKYERLVIFTERNVT